LEKMGSFQQLTTETKAGSNYVLTTDTSLSLGSLISLMPKAWLVSTLRPFPWEIHGIFTILPLMENVLFFVLTLIFLIKLIKKRDGLATDHRLLTLLYFFLFFASCQFILCGLISVNFGALSRYRMPGFLGWYMLPAILASMGAKKAR